MNLSHSAASSVHSICEWCGESTVNNQLKTVCQHRICDRCIIRDKKCQSDCPMCWYVNGEQFIKSNKVCSGKSKVPIVETKKIC